MEQSDLLDSQTSNQGTTTIDGGNFGVLLPAILLDRLSYYSFRGVMVLFAIQVFGFERSDAIYQYGTFTTLIYLSTIIGAVLGDFVIKALPSIIIGSVICALGAALCLIRSLDAFYIGCFLVIMGSALSKPNLLAHVARLTGRDMKKLDSRFMLIYIFINIGAFIAAGVVLYFTEIYGHYIGFIVAAAAWLISASLLFLTRHVSTNSVTSIQVSNLPIKYSKPRYSNIAILLVPILGSVLYWISVELQYPFYSPAILLDGAIFDRGSIQFFLLTYANLLALIPLGFLLYFMFRKVALHPLQKMAIGLMLMALAWGLVLLAPDAINVDSMILTFVAIAILHAFSELFIAPSIMSTIALHTPKKILGLAYSMYFILVAIGIRWGTSFVLSHNSWMTTIVLLILCVGLAFTLFFLPYVFSTKAQSVEEQPDILEE